MKNFFHKCLICVPEKWPTPLSSPVGGWISVPHAKFWAQNKAKSLYLIIPLVKVHFFQKGGFEGTFSKKCHFLKTKLNIFEKIPIKSPSLKKIELWTIGHQAYTLSNIYKPKILHVGQKLSPLTDLKVAHITFVDHEKSFLTKKCPKKPPFWRKFSLWPIGYSSRWS